MDGNCFNISVENLVWATRAEFHRLTKNFSTWKEVLAEIKQTNNVYISLKNLVSEYSITPNVRIHQQ